MKNSEYIPLAQTPSGSWPQVELEPPPRLSRFRRRAIFGTALVIFLVGFYFVAAELVDDDSEDLDYADDDLNLISEFQAAYLPFEFAHHNASSVNARLTPAQELPDYCRDAYMSAGALCFDPDIEPMDIVWTWVNGSDVLLQEAKLLAESQFAEDDPYRPKTSARQERQYRKDWVDENVELNFIHHADIFQSYNNTTFNSYGIESQFGHLQGVSDYFVYMNDDFYMSNPLTMRSFYTSVYGLVLRYDLGIMVGPNKPPPDEPHGEWRSMGESNVLLSARFGARHRPYVLHEAKGVSLSLLQEITAMWPQPLEKAASHPFRETVSGEGDVSMLFIMVHFVVERWREALLWSWTVGKHGGLGDVWDDVTAQDAWRELGGEWGQAELEVEAGYRDTLENQRVAAYFKLSGHRKPDKTQYRFSSGDGYPYAYAEEHHHDEWPSFTSDTPADRLPICTMSYDECFTHEGSGFSAATGMFKHIAFRNPKCGDCVIQALVKASGGEFASDPYEVPHLPLEERWEDAEFNVFSVMGASRETNVRAWTLRLLQRYRFVVAYTPYAFVMLETVDNAQGALGWIDSYTDASMLCINDDVKEDEEEVTDIFRSWQERRWGKPAYWERRPS
ncbi:hypothetical protein EW026_g250 [Hermanssonia centrifuga]|uniref:Stealth protein CR3 conserved region 3 domain-containing protein n=1 Tax=Hermanssonia centrifuga TaxID=98765 RepID=A0A4S4KV42_9APHY|nr:hypothetical protein EW026_g250 [Hermanssonia centrifuga]